MHWATLSFLAFIALPLAQAQSVYPAGVTERRLQPSRASYNWRGSQSQALYTIIWYPAAANAAVEDRWVGPPGSAFAKAGRAAPNAVLADKPAKFPVVVMSHGNGGSALMLAWLGTRLAEAGFIAAAVNHPGNNALEPYTPQGFALWWERANDMSEVLNALLKDSQFGPRIDPSRVGAAGFSLGGFTAIELAGGIGTHARLQEFCKSKNADAMCKPQVEFPDLEDKAAAVAQTPEFARSVAESERSHRDARIKAVFTIAPALGPAFLPGDLQKIRIPVAIVSGDADPVVPIESSARFFAKHIRGATLTLYPGGVGHYTFLAVCTEQAKRDQPAYCADPAGVNREAIHSQAAAEAIRFFRKHL